MRPEHYDVVVIGGGDGGRPLGAARTRPPPPPRDTQVRGPGGGQAGLAIG